MRTLTLRDPAHLAPKATVTSVLAEGSTADAPSYTTAAFTPVAGKHYIVMAATNQGTPLQAALASLSTTTGLTFVPMACPGADGAVYARPLPVGKIIQHWIAYATGTPTSGTVTVTMASGSFLNVTVSVASITGAHVGAAATDCLVQAGRYESFVGTTTTTKISVHPFTDANNATLAFITNGSASAMTAGAGMTVVSQVAGGNIIQSGIFAAQGQVLEPSASWGTAGSPTIVAYEIRAALTATPSALDVRPKGSAGFIDGGATLTKVLTALPVTSGTPCIIAIHSPRTGGASAPTTVAGATNTWTLLATAVTFDTVGTPTRRLSVWLCANPTTVTENVTATWATTHIASMVAVDVIGGHLTALVPQLATANGDAATALTPTLTAPTGGVLVFAGADGTSDIISGTGAGLRRLFDSSKDGNNDGWWSADASRKVYGFWRDTPQAANQVDLGTARDSGAIALEIRPA